MAPVARKKAGRPKTKGALWSTEMRFRPYLQVDFRKEPALHCLLFDNPSDLGDLIRRGIELAMAEKNLKYLDPAFQQKFAAQASGLGHQASIPAPVIEDLAITAAPNPTQVPDIANSHDSFTLPQIMQSQPAIVSPTPFSMQPDQPLVTKPKPPPSISNFLSKAIADGQ